MKRITPRVVLFGILTCTALQAAEPATRPAVPEQQKTQILKLRDHSAPVPGSEAGKWTDYSAMHNYFVDEFVNSPGFGISRLETPRERARRNTLYAEGKSYRVGQVQLISLGLPDKEGKAGESFAYEVPHLDATKSALKKADRRALAPLEAKALAQLKEGKETVLGEEDGKTKLIGAVRATQSCLECHKVKEGTLLGAFTYPLVAVAEPKQPAERK